MSGIDCTDGTGRTALHIAVENNDVEALKILLQHNADINIPNSSGETPLYLALMNGRHEIAQCFIQNKPKVAKAKADVEPTDTDGMTMLQLAVFRGYTDVVKYLLEQHGANVNTLSTFNYKGFLVYQAALHIACEKNYPEIVGMLMAHGADMNLKCKGGQTALHIAVENKHTKCIESLLKKNTIH